MILKNSVKKGISFLLVLSILFSLIPVDSLQGWLGFSARAATNIGDEFWASEEGGPSYHVRVTDYRDGYYYGEIIDYNGKVGSLTVLGLTLPLFLLRNRTDIVYLESIKSMGNTYAKELKAITTRSPIERGGIKSIQKDALINCGKLEELNLGMDFETLDSGALNGTNIKEVLIFPKEKSLGGLLNNTNEIDVTISNYGQYSNSTLPTKLLQNQSKIKKVKVISCDGSSIDYPRITSIGESTFENCTTLETITIQSADYVTKVGNYAFKNCKALDSNFFSSLRSLRTIGTGAFEGSGLSSVSLPYYVNTMGSNAFRNCTNLKAFSFGTNLKEIPENALYGCANLTTVALNSVSTIGTGAFEGSGLENVTIPNSVKTMGSNAFRNCTSLNTFTFGTGLNEIPDYSLYNCTSLTSVTIPDSIIKIGANSFNGCTSLTSVTIPDSLTSIGAGAFNGCNGMVLMLGEQITEIGGINKSSLSSHNYDSTFTGCEKIICIKDSFAHKYLEKSANLTEGKHYEVFDDFSIFDEGKVVVKLIGEEGKPVDLAMVTVKSDAVTKNPISNKYGYLVLPSDSVNDPNGKVIEISGIPGYRGYKFNTKVLDTSAAFQNLRLQPMTGGENDPYISSLFYRKNSADSWKEGFSSQIAVTEKEGDTIELEVYTGGSGSPQAVLFQDDTCTRTINNNGSYSFEIDENGSDKSFQPDKSVYIRAGSGTNWSAPRETQIKILKSLPGIKEEFLPEVINLPSTNVTLPQNNNAMSLLGGLEFGLDPILRKMNIKVKVEDNRIKIVAGCKESAPIFIEGDRNPETSWKKLKQAIKDAGKSEDGINNYIEKQKNAEILKGFKLDGEIGWFLELEILPTGECTTIDSGGYIKLDGKFSKPIYFTLFPAYLDVTVGAKMEVKFSVRWDIDLTQKTAWAVPPQLNLNFNFDIPYAELGLALGLKGVLSAGVYGSGAFNIKYNVGDYLKNDSLNYKLKAKASFKVQFLFIKKSWDIWKPKGDGVVWEYPEKPKASPLLQAARSASSENLQAVKKINPMTWTGESVPVLRASSRPNEELGDTLKILAKNVHEDNRHQIVDIGGGKKLMCFIMFDKERPDGNNAKLVYSIYDPDTRIWSDPKTVSDDSTADFYPSLASDGENSWVAWQNTKKVLTRTETLDPMKRLAATMDNGEICVAKFNGNDFDAPQTLTNNNTWDTMPEIAIGEGGPQVAWVNDTQPNPLSEVEGAYEGKSALWFSRFQEGKWSTPSILKNNMTEIHSMDAAVKDDKLYIAYAYDIGNNNTTLDALDIFQITVDGSDVQTRRLSKEDTANCAPKYGIVNGQLYLFWYSGDNLQWIKDLDSGEAELVFNGDTSVNDTFTIAQSNSKNSCIVWSQLVTDVLENNSVEKHVEFFTSVFDGNGWSMPVQLSSTGAKALDPAVFIDQDGVVQAVFTNIPQVPVTDTKGNVLHYIDASDDTDGSATEEKPQLCQLSVSPRPKLSLSDENLYIAAEDVIPGGTISLPLKVSSTGLSTANGVDFYINGSLVKTENITLRPGESYDEVGLTYKMPSKIAETHLNIIAVPKGETLKESEENKVTVSLGHPDLTVSDTMVINTGAKDELQMTILNEGHTDAGEFTVQVRKYNEEKDNGSEGEILYSKDFEGLSPTQKCYWSCPLEDWGDGSDHQRYYIEIVTDQTEYSKTNNCAAEIYVKNNKKVSGTVSLVSGTGSSRTVSSVVQNHTSQTQSVSVLNVVRNTEGDEFRGAYKNLTLAPYETLTLSEVVSSFTGTYLGTDIIIVQGPVTTWTDVSGVTLNKTELNIKAGGSAKLEAKIEPAGASLNSLVWSSSNESVATVDENGLVTGVSPGEAKITASTVLGAKKAEANVKVLPVTPTSIKITHEEMELSVGDEFTLTTEISPEDVTDKSLIWSSNKPEVVSVDQNGKITALKEGKATIVVMTRAGECRDLLNVVVVIKPKSITINTDGTNMDMGDTKQLSAEVLPANVTDNRVIWKSMNTMVASVDENGFVTANNAGDVRIVAETVDGKLSAYQDLVITNPEGSMITFIQIIGNVKGKGEVLGTGLFTEGEMVVLEAAAHDGYRFEGWYENGVKLESIGKNYSFTAQTDRTLTARFIKITRLSGIDRLNTANTIAKTGWADGSDYVILANGMNFADALSGGPLAYAVDAPILLTLNGAALEDTVAKTITDDLKAKKVIILGGFNAVNEGIENSLKDKNLEVTRISGRTRYETAIEIAKALAEKVGSFDTAFLADGTNFPDALAGSSPAAILGQPILFTNGKDRKSVTAVTGEYIKNSGIKNLVVLGGDKAISLDIDNKMKDECGLLKTKRLSGLNRYRTSLAVYYEYRDLFDGETVALATGDNYPDALVGGVFAAKNHIPVILINGESVVEDIQKAIRQAGTSRIYVFGGTRVLSDRIVDANLFN